MQGIMTFDSISQALRAGYQVYDRADAGYVVRTKTKNGWAMALVVCK